jgi:hypothetical protein
MYISERKYKNALAVVNQYRAQQKELEKNKVKESGITLATTLKELKDNNFISPKLYRTLEETYKWEYAYSINDTPLEPYLGFFIGTTKEDVLNYINNQ